MVELIEYVVVFALSAGVAGASLMLVNGAVPGLRQVAVATEADQIAGAARIAGVAGAGNTTLVLPVHDSAVSCAAGSLSVSIDGAAPKRYPLSYPCSSFNFEGLNGVCTFVFSAPGGSLQMEVGC